MMRALILLHRWLGVAFCLLFAMWFASGIVMHFVPFPALTKRTLCRIGADRPRRRQARSGGSQSRVSGFERRRPRAPDPAQRRAGLSGLRLIGRGRASCRRSCQMAPCTPTPVGARDRHGLRARRHLDASRGRRRRAGGLRSVDGAEWLRSHRPLYRVALNDDLGTELYVSSTTPARVVLDTTRRQRAWNYIGSIAHWIYPTALRSHPAAWSRLVWWLSLVALIGATAGAVDRHAAARRARDRVFRRLIAAGKHGITGLACACMLFLLTWMLQRLAVDG